MRKFVLITGGTSGLGRAIANILVSKYDLALGYQENEERAQQAVLEISQLCTDAKVRSYKVPLRDYKSSQLLYRAVVNDFSENHLYGFIHCAGAPPPLFTLPVPLKINYLLLKSISSLVWHWLISVCLPCIKTNLDVLFL